MERWDTFFHQGNRSLVSGGGVGCRNSVSTLFVVCLFLFGLVQSTSSRLQEVSEIVQFYADRFLLIYNWNLEIRFLVSLTLETVNKEAQRLQKKEKSSVFIVMRSSRGPHYR